MKQKIFIPSCILLCFLILFGLIFRQNSEPLKRVRTQRIETLALPVSAMSSVTAPLENGSFYVFTQDDDRRVFDSYAEAAAFARTQRRAFVYCRRNKRLVWDNIIKLPVQIRASVALTLQMPELPRGCEVTSLAMFLNSQGITADKMTLAERIAKDDTPYETHDGKIYYGNPNRGFVGSMDNIKKNGLGVYHKPIFNLLKEYLPDDAIDLTGCEYEDLEYFLAMHIPVWVIVNTTYQPLPEDNFVTWHTPDGPIQITYHEHSVLLTGYDDQNVYFNDPLGNSSSAAKKDFAAAWEQMGRQAVSRMP